MPCGHLQASIQRAAFPVPRSSLPPNHILLRFRKHSKTNFRVLHGTFWEPRQRSMSMDSTLRSMQESFCVKKFGRRSVQFVQKSMSGLRAFLVQTWRENRAHHCCIVRDVRTWHSIFADFDCPLMDAQIWTQSGTVLYTRMHAIVLSPILSNTDAL